MGRFLLFVALLTSAVGCSSDAELSKSDDKQLRNNFSRALTPEEVAQMGKSSSEGASRPERTAH